MRSLFAKILAWFALTLLITIAATLLTTAMTYDADSSRQAPFSMLLSVELREARRAWEHGGADELRQTLARFRAASFASEVILADGNGTDLLTGKSQAKLMRAALSWTHFPFSGPPSAPHGRAFARLSQDGRYCIILFRDAWYFWFLQPADLFVIVLVVLLCWGLASHLTAPVQRLRYAVDRFGRGDLSVRAEESSSDEMGELAAAFNRMADHIQTLLAAERRLLFDISHELRSPLARLSVAVELARTDEAGSLPLNRIQREADRLNALIRQMLEVTRTEGNPSRLKAEHLRLDELIYSLVDDCSIEARARGCALDLVSTGEVLFDGDRELLRRAVENVLRNAIRFAPAQSKVEVTLVNGAGTVTIRVRDFGPGVPEEALPRLFDPFYRVAKDRDRKSGGVGLGLAIARRAVELHKGQLRASNALPGLLVEIELPASVS